MKRDSLGRIADLMTQQPQTPPEIDILVICEIAVIESAGSFKCFAFNYKISAAGERQTFGRGEFLRCGFLAVTFLESPSEQVD